MNTRPKWLKPNNFSKMKKLCRPFMKIYQWKDVMVRFNLLIWVFSGKKPKNTRNSFYPVVK